MTAKEELLDWARKKLAKEKDKWECGTKNKYFEWEDFYEHLVNSLNAAEVKADAKVKK